MSLPEEFRQFFRIQPYTNGTFAIQSRTDTPPEAFAALEAELMDLYPDFTFYSEYLSNQEAETKVNGQS